MQQAKVISVAVDPALIEQVQELGIDLTTLVEAAMVAEIAKSRSGTTAEAWRQENADAIEAWNEEVRRNGLWSDTLRQF